MDGRRKEGSVTGDLKLIAVPGMADPFAFQFKVFTPGNTRQMTDDRNRRFFTGYF